MTYAASAAKTSGKKPIWLYQIEFGSSEAFLTSRAKDFPDTVVAMQTWLASPTRHSRIVQTTNIEKSGVSVTLKRTEPIAQAIRDDQGVTATRVRIWHTYLDDPDQEVVAKFDGRVVGVKPGLAWITLECENSFTQFRRKALAAVMQRPCRHALYHGGCGLLLSNFETAATATNWTAPVLTVTEAGVQTDGYYSGGIVSYGGTPQMIVKHTGTSLKLIGPVPALAAEIIASGTAAVNIAPGCDLTTETCDTRFSNLDNHGGFPWLTDTPFDGRNPF